MEPQSRCPLSVNTKCEPSDYEIAAPFGSIDQAHHWLASCTLIYLDRPASCLLLSNPPSPQDHNLTISTSSTQLGTLAQMTGSSQEAFQETLGLALSAFEESTESSSQHHPLTSTMLNVQETTVGSQQPPVLTLSGF